MHKKKGFTPQAKGMMVLAKETHQGIDIIGNHFRARFHTYCNLLFIYVAVKSFVEIVKYIFKEILSE